MDPDDFSAEQRKQIDTKIDELTTIIKDITGNGVDLMFVCHQHHGDGDQCHGVFLLSSKDIPMYKAHNMLMQGTILMEGAIIQDATENYPPPGTRLN